MVSAEEAAGAALLHSSVRRHLVDTLANLPTVADADAGLPERAEGLSAAELAELVDLHVTTVRFHLDQLEQAGLVRSHFVKSEGRGRPRKLYAVSPGPVVTPGHDALLPLTTMLAEFFEGDPDGRPLTPEEAGEAWADRHVEAPAQPVAANSPGAWLGKVGQAVDVLERWGYTANIRTSNKGRSVEIELHDCPFIEVVKSHPGVVCGIHRGLLRGVLARLGETDVEVGLNPLVAPNTCTANATTRSAFVTREGNP